MTDEKKPVALPRVVEAIFFRNSTAMGSIYLQGSTKHGATALLGVDVDILLAGDVIKTKEFVLNAREFVVVGLHTKPMKLTGVWYEVRTVAAPAKKPKGRK